VFPNIYRDMRHPYKYRRAVDITYAFSFLLDLGMAVIGLLMFGDEVQDEITSNILLSPGYPPALSIFLVGCIAIIPLTKVPLNARPIVSTVEIMTGLLGPSSQETNFANISARVLVRVVTTVAFVLIAIVFPSFDRIMTLLGAVCCFSICIILPVAFHLRLFGKELGYAERVANWVLLIASCIMGLISTVFACLPREILSGKP
jgi:solute carrier family 32 (vesicular inhibitory amino acid transporter)